MTFDVDELEVAINLKPLYNDLGRELAHGTIVEEMNFENNERYYDMYNESGELCCVDGEIHKIVDVNDVDKYIEFIDTNDDHLINFQLNYSEAAVALAENDIRKIENEYRVKLSPTEALKETKKVRSSVDRDDR